MESFYNSKVKWLALKKKAIGRINEDQNHWIYLIIYDQLHKNAPCNPFKNNNWFISTPAHNASLCPL